MFLFLRDNGIYFKVKELEKESKDCKYYDNKEEILERCNSLKEFNVIGLTSLKLKEYLIGKCKENISIKEKIYIVRLLNNKFCFCSKEGKVINIEL